LDEYGSEHGVDIDTAVKSMPLKKKVDQK
jgi:hypothetical protein